MKLEEILQKTKDIASKLDDQGFVTSELTNIYNEFESLTNTNTSLQEENEKLKTANQNLQNYNMELFQQVGSQNKDVNNKNNGSLHLDPIKKEDENNEDKVDFKSLFNEKGELNL